MWWLYGCFVTSPVHNRCSRWQCGLAWHTRSCRNWPAVNIDHLIHLYMHKFGVKLLVHWQKLLSFCGFAPDPVFWGFVLQHAIKRCTVPLDSAGDFHPRLSGLNCPPTSEDLVYCTNWAPVIYVIIFIKRGCQIDIHLQTHFVNQVDPDALFFTLTPFHTCQFITITCTIYHSVTLFLQAQNLSFPKSFPSETPASSSLPLQTPFEPTLLLNGFFILVFHFHFPFVFIVWLWAVD